MSRDLGFDTKSALEIARIINHEDAKVAAAVKKALPEIAIVIDTVARSLRDGGRLIYVGAGSSGRIAALDASECPPTYSTSSLAGAIHHGRRPQGPRLSLRRQRRFPRTRPARHRPPPPHAQGHRHRRLRQRPHPLRRRRRRVRPRPRSQDRRVTCNLNTPLARSPTPPSSPRSAPRSSPARPA
jgi:hypothetical protein